MLQVFKVFTKKRFWKKLCTVLLCLVLCFTLVVNSVVDVFANPVAVGLFELILAILAACGITFGTVALAHDGVDAFTSGASSGVMDLLNSKLAEIATLAATAGVVYTIGINFLSEQWQMITADVVRIFGDFKGITAHLNIDSPGMLKLGGDAFNFSVPGVGPSSAVSVSVGNVTMQYIGGKSQAIDSIKPLIASRHLSFSEDRVYILMSTQISGLKFLCDLGRFSSDASVTFNDSFSLYTSSTIYPYPVISSKVFDFNSGGQNYINGLLDGKWFRISNVVDKACTFTLNYVDESDIYNSVGANIVVGNKLGDYTLGDSICPDGIWSRKSYADWLNDLLFGSGAGVASDIPSVGALPGDAGIDTTAYPGNDTWHDGIDDVATGSPSIGISVPTDVSDDDIATLNPSKARDYSNADVKDKDVTTGDNDKPGDKDDDKDKTGTTPKVPAIGLPEILFKTKFPFCLPWDLYNLFAVLAAEPEAPKFVIPYKNNMLGIDEEYVLDFSKYEDAAKIIRFFTGAGFVLALILISRKLTGSE